MKTIKITTIIVSLSLLFNACKKETIVSNPLVSGGPVLMKFINNTGVDLTNLVIANTSIGVLNNGDSTAYISYSQFGFDSGMPDERSEAIDKNNGSQIKSYNQFYWCGTQKGTITQGTFDVKLILQNLNNTNYIQLIKK